MRSCESLLRLPEEIILKILQFLDPSEIEELIEFSGDSHLKQLAFRRLYSGKTLVHSCISSYEPPYIGIEGNAEDDFFDTCIAYQDFQGTFGQDAAQNLSKSIFVSTRPKVLEFDFYRESEDYHDFVSSLRMFIQYMEQLSSGEASESCRAAKKPMHRSSTPAAVQIADYLRTVHQFNLRVHGIPDDIEFPSTTHAVIALKLLTCLAIPENPLKDRIMELELSAMDLGEYYQDKWSQLFSRFVNLQKLNLSENLIRSAHMDEKHSISTYVNWPPRLKVLNVSNNYIEDASGFILTLPRSLEKLDMTNNPFETFGDDVIGTTTPTGSSFRRCIKLAEVLPNLRLLDLAHNSHLTYINPKIFESTGSSCSLEVKISLSPIDGDNMRELEAASKRTGFTLYNNDPRDVC